MQIASWVVRQSATPMTFEPRDEAPGPGEVLVEVAGCGVCHTDLGFYYDGVPTRHPFPLTLGHEISGTRGRGRRRRRGVARPRPVVVPAVIPCGECDACRAGRGPICPKPDLSRATTSHGGFATHVRVPARGLCPVPRPGRSDDQPAAASTSRRCR